MHHPAEDRTMLVVRHSGRGGRDVLRLGVQELEDHQGRTLSKRGPRRSRRGGGLGDGGRLRDHGKQKFAALNGGPQFTFDEAVSFQIYCENQTEVDYFWNRLTEGGQERPCGWLKDKYGLSWQVVPVELLQMMDPDARKSAWGMKAFLKMKNFDIATLKRAFEGETV